jgi:hypothetical protein
MYGMPTQSNKRLDISTGSSLADKMSDSQQYWLPGFGLSRHIVLGHIQYFLGPDASVRPYTYQVCETNQERSCAKREALISE